METDEEKKRNSQDKKKRVPGLEFCVFSYIIDTQSSMMMKQPLSVSYLFIVIYIFFFLPYSFYFFMIARRMAMKSPNIASLFCPKGVPCRLSNHPLQQTSLATDSPTVFSVLPYCRCLLLYGPRRIRKKGRKKN